MAARPERRLGRTAVVAIATLGVLTAAAVDYAAGYEIRTYPLYYFPIAYGAWRLSRPLALSLAILSAVAWLVSNHAAGAVHAPYVWTVNWLAQALAFGLVAYLIAELRRRLLVEQELSRQDSLTGLPNRRAFTERAQLLVAIARRTEAPLTLAYLDLDGFKAVNDARGHHEGDRALIATADALRRFARASDLVARLGGDEFALLLSDTDPEAARTSLERVRRAVAVTMRERGWPITVSIGALSYRRAPPTFEEALSRADASMYRAKQSGKDCVHQETVDERPPEPQRRPVRSEEHP